MIHCDDGKLDYDGYAGQLLAEYLQITDNLLQEIPELVPVVFYKRATIINEVMQNCNAKTLLTGEQIVDEIDEARRRNHE